MEIKPLKKVLRSVHIWAIGVGLVISGEYFGWNLGWQAGGTMGLLIATLIIAALYFTFIFSFTELTTAIPQAGGPFTYALKAFGATGGLVAGYASVVEFVFATPAIALALGSYVHFLYPAVPVMVVAVVAYFIFTGINLLGIKEAANFSLVMTILAIAELLIFFAITAPHFQLHRFMQHAMPHHWAGVFAALPFAIWLFVCLEGIAMVAEETKENSAIVKGYISALLTLTVLALGVMFCVGGVANWQTMATIDYPLPASIAVVLGNDNAWTKLFAGIGLFGLVASFHGIIISYSRQLFALSRSGYLPAAISKVSNKKQVPFVALVVGAVIGLLSLFFLDTGDLVILSTIGAVIVYIISMLSLFKLRRSSPTMARPFIAPFYPYFPAIALVLALIALAAMIYSYTFLCLVFLIGMLLLFIIFYGAGIHKKFIDETKKAL